MNWTTRIVVLLLLLSIATMSPFSAAEAATKGGKKSKSAASKTDRPVGKQPLSKKEAAQKRAHELLVILKAKEHYARSSMLPPPNKHMQDKMQSGMW